MSEGKVESSPDKVCTARARMMPNGQLRCFCSGCSRKTYQPVCGNDGGNYSSECELRKKACRHRRFDMEVAYEGTCQCKLSLTSSYRNLPCFFSNYSLVSTERVPVFKLHPGDKSTKCCKAYLEGSKKNEPCLK